MRLHEDDVLYGKSCVYSNKEGWICRDCGLDCQYEKWEDCPLLKRHKNSDSGSPRLDWNDPQQLTVEHQPQSAGNPFYEYAFQPGFKVGQDSGHPRGFLERLPCRDGLLDAECFDLANCDVGAPLKLFVYGHPDGMIANYSVSMMQRYPGIFQIETNASNACLKVLSCDIYSSFENEPFKLAESSSEIT